MTQNLTRLGNKKLRKLLLKLAKVFMQNCRCLQKTTTTKSKAAFGL